MFDEVVWEDFGDVLNGHILGDDFDDNLGGPAAGDDFLQMTIELSVVTFPEML